ncbi:hypothetical protein [Sphingomicrobium nitratireducens]|uniref:hypothetical protein n=1 Tax=Sphingomicrobium nitratireducens TaxID=2964666 RepID=UPI00224007B4|nr:hypothetical protein [Sphingomicrobium nitratireducens]
MDNSERLAKWRKKKEAEGGSIGHQSGTVDPVDLPEAPPTRQASEYEGPSAAELAAAAPGASPRRAGPVPPRAATAAARIDGDTRRLNDLLPDDEALAAQRRKLVETAYADGRARLQRIALYALLPLLLLAAYLGLVAPHYFQSYSSFSVLSAGESDAGPAGSMMGIGFGPQLTDSYTVKEYLRSAEAMALVDKQEKFLDHFDKSQGEGALEFYRDRIGLTVDQQEGIVALRVDARTPEDSVRFANALLDLGQAKVREIAAQIEEDQLALLKDEVEDSERQLKTALKELQTLQVARSEIDPRMSAEGIFTIINELETNLAEQEAQRAAILSNGLDQSPLLPRINARIAALKSQIARQEARLVQARDGNTVQRSIALFENAQAEKVAAETALAAARETYDRARVRGVDQRKYLVVIAKPMLPEGPTRSRLFDMSLALAGALALYIAVRYAMLRRRRDNDA